MNRRRRVLITEGQERSSVAICRSLAAAGFTVAVAADQRPAVAQWSRFCSERVRVAPPQWQPEAFVSALRALFQARRFAVLIPAGDNSLMVLSRYRAELEPYLEAGLGLPPDETVRSASDKATLQRAAAAAGLALPQTRVCAGPGEARAAAQSFGYPVLVKPRLSVIEVHERTHREASRIAHDDAELEALVDLFGGSCLVQRQEQGTIHSLGGVFAGGRLLSLSFSRYLRTWPPEAGGAAFAQTVPIPAELRERIPALLSAIGWQGIFELELIGTPDGRFLAVDFNPRVYGSISQAVRAGADHPRVWCEWLLGGAPEYAESRAGIWYRWDDSEVRRLVWELRGRRFRAALGVLREPRGTAHSHFRLDDPGPFVARALKSAKGKARRLAEQRADAAIPR